MQGDVKSAILLLTAIEEAARYNLFSCHLIPFLLPAEERLFVALSGDKGVESGVSGIALSLNEAGWLLTYSTRMASYALQTRSPECIANGIRSLVLDNDLLDPRDVLTVASMLNDAAVRLGVDASKMFKEAITRASKMRSLTLRPFTLDPSHSPAISSMGCEIITTPHGPAYQLRM